MNTLDDRVTRLEREMKDVRHTAATRLPAGATHEEVEVVRVELRTQGTVLRALRLSQDKHAREMHEGFADVRSEVSEVRTEVAEVRVEVADMRSEMRSEFADVRSEMRSEFADVRSEMRSGFADVRSEISTIHDRLQAHDRSLEALRQTQVEQGQEMREGFTTLNLGMAQMTALLTIAMKKDED